MTEALTLIRSFFSLETLIYAAIVLVTVFSMLRCFVPLAAAASRLRKAARTMVLENKQNKERKSWRDLQFLGGQMEAIWADFLQNAELREAHGETCDVSLYVNEESVIYTAGSVALADIVPGILTSLGILGTFLGLVRGLSGLRLDAADTQQLLSAMEQLIGGMSTAFLTSIAGVSASLLFSLLNNHYMGKCRKAIDRFCEVFSLYAMPKPVSQETELLTLQQEMTAYLRQAADEMGQRLASQMEGSILRATLPMQRSMDNFIVAATQAQVEGVDRIVQLFIQRMNSALGGELEYLRKSLAEARSAQQVSSQELTAATQAISEMGHDVINMHQMSQGLLEHFKAYVTEMDGSRARADEQQKQTAEAIAAAEKQIAGQTQLLERLIAAQDALEKASRSYLEASERFAKQTSPKLKAALQSAEEAADHLQEGARALSGASDQLVRESAGRAEALTQASRELAAAVQELSDALAQTAAKPERDDA
ncbi:MAG: MotA/TolQ/ExbB proton channel family protein [Clostridia bacterium]|nr:MotA/TolQ/ExbB proton channel family protein [Clostridia bacterium]